MIAPLLPDEPDFSYRPHAAPRRPAMVRQHDAQDCGAAALATICAYHGVRPNLRVVRRLLDVGADGASMAGLLRAAERLGLVARGLALDAEDLGSLPLPALTTQGYHFVVLHAVHVNEVVIGDPARGWRTLPRAAFEAGWSGHVLVFNGAPEARWQGAPIWERARPLFDPFKAAMLGSVGLALAVNGLALGLPVLTQRLVDQTLALTEARVPLAVGGALALHAAVEAGRLALVNRVSAAVQVSVGRQLVDRALRLPLPFFQTRQTGDLVTRLDEVGRLSGFIGDRGAEAVVDGLLAVGALALVTAYAPGLGLGLAAMCALILVAAVAVGRRSAALTLHAAKRSGEATGLFLESTRRIAVIRAHAAEARWLDRWARAAGEGATLAVRGRDLAGLMSVGLSICTRAAPLGVALAGAATLSAGALLAVSSVTLAALASVAGLAAAALEAPRVLLGVERLLDVLEEEPDEPAGIADPAPATGDLRALRLEGLRYRYQEEGPDVVDGVDLDVAPGEWVAVVGPSGSGKSTLGLLMSRLLRPTAGVVRLGGVDVRELPASTLRGAVAVVPQEAALVRGTVLDNIALGDAKPDRARAAEAAQLAGAAEFIDEHPRAYDRVLSEDGGGLSVGQRQRLALARALYRQPSLLILDEPTAALDPSSERAILRTLEALRGRVSLVMIAHRLNTVAGVDRVVVMQEGRVVEQGRERELRQTGGAYRAMVERAAA